MRARLADFDRALLVLALLLTVVGLVYFWTPTDPDVWWHLRNGQVVLATGTVPHGDLYSFTVPGARWIMQQWLLEAAMWTLETTLGYWANVLLFAAVSVGVYVLLFHLLRGEGAGRLLAAGLVGVALILDAPTWGVRPQIWTTLLFAAFLTILLRYRRVGPDRGLWLLPPLMLLWANVHAGFSAGLLLLAAFVVGETLNRLLGWPAAPVRPLLAVTAACAVISLLNPNGLDLWLYPLTYLSGPGGNASLRFVQEWLPPDLRSPRAWPFLATLLSLLALNLVRRMAPGPGPTVSPGRTTWGDATLMICCAGFTLMALQALRFLPLYALIWAVLAARRAVDLWPPKAQPLTADPAQEARAVRFSRVNLVTYGLVAVVLAVIILGSPRAQVHATPLETAYPAGAVAYLAAQSGAQPLRPFHEYGWGGYLIAHGLPVFVDGRADPYNTLLDEYVAAGAGRDWQAIFAKYAVNTALLPPAHPLIPLLTAAGWTRAYGDPVAVVYSKP
ncbi:MAG TPA: hypothetical protein VM536_17260 [Chloroflexia bacterium]|nr:hypothetical protein [Chloroflexia bacterium]